MKNEKKIPAFSDLRSFVEELERRELLITVDERVSLRHEITALHHRVLAENGPALLFRNPVDAAGRASSIPVLVNLFGTKERIELGFGLGPGGLRRLGEELAELQRPTPPKSLGDAWARLPLVKAALSMRPKNRRTPPVQEVVYGAGELDLAQLPVQWCWPGEPAPLITWPLVITRSPDDPSDINVGIYRMQVRDSRSLIVRWLAHRGGAKHFREWKRKGVDMPITIAIGADPATLLAAVIPIPEGMSELNFAGLLRGARTEVSRAVSVPMPIPSNAEIVLEGIVSTEETDLEGPYGDHTGYYNAVDRYPVVQLKAITTRRAPIYLSTYTGRPPDEPSRLGEAMTELFIPVAKQQFPEITDLWLPPEACSYRAAVIAIDKRYPGQARRVMMGLWSMLPQFNYTKLIIAVDSDINVRSWEDVFWAISTRFDASRDLLLLERTPIDQLDFASPVSGLGTKMGVDATNKLDGETNREWGTALHMPAALSEWATQTWERIRRDIRT